MSVPSSITVSVQANVGSSAPASIVAKQPAGVAAGRWKSEGDRPAQKGSPLPLRMRRSSAGDLKLSLAPVNAKLKPNSGALGGFLAGLEQEYTIGATLGQGATSLVQKAVRRYDGAHVALKRLATNGDPELARMAQAEFGMLRQLHHPNVIGAIDMKSQEGYSVMVMEYFEGCTLQEAVRKAPPGRLPENAVRYLACALLEGLRYLHNSGVVHRDLKPQNVMVDSDLEQLKIIDFNSAYAWDGSDPLSPAGTRMYAAPEALLGGPPSMSGDVWSAGLCVYFALSGRLPQKRDRCATVSRLEMAAISEVDLSIPGVSQDCIAFLDRCLTLDVGSRPSAKELLEDPWLQFPGLTAWPLPMTRCSTGSTDALAES